LPHRQTDGLVVDVRVRHALADRLEHGDRLVELLAVGRVLGADAHGFAAGARGDRAQPDHRPVEDPAEDLVALPERADERVVGGRGSAPSSTSAALSNVSPATMLGRYCSCCAALPNRSIGIAAETRVESSGIIATRLPCCSSSRHMSTKPPPLPPTASGSA